MASKRKKHPFLRHLKSIGFSNRLAIYVLIFLFIGLVGGFVLALISIKADYVGALACWTIVFTPLGTATSIVLSRIVDKSRAENTKGGIKYEQIFTESDTITDATAIEDEYDEMQI